MKKISLIEIYLIFLKIGMQLLGGGYVILPLLSKYLVKEREILTQEELIDYFALSQCIPGIIAGNISIFTGYKMHRTLGAITAILGVITAPFLTIILFAHILMNEFNNEWVQAAFYGIKISVIILVLLTIKEMWTKSVNSKFTCILFFILLLMLLLFNISPAITVVIAAVVTYLYMRIKERINA